MDRTPIAASPDYFPMGFVHGNVHLTRDQGYTFRQLPSSALDFADGAPWPRLPDYTQPTDLRFHSLIIAAESITGRLNEAAKAGRTSASTRDYGELPLSLDPQGKPWPRSLDKIDIFDPSTLRYLRDHVRCHVREQNAGPLNDRILLWGLDNEWEGRANYSPAALKAFRDWLVRVYDGDISQLNAAWRTAHTDFGETIAGTLPEDGDHRTTPARFLDWWHFQSEYFTAFLAGLARLVAESDPLHRGVVHKATQLTLEMPAWRERLLDQARFADLIRPHSGGYFGIDMYGHGDRQAYETNYVFHCIRPADRSPGHGVMLCENNNHNGPAGQFAATQWRLLANGVKGMMYFTTGYAGGTADWDHFSFLEPATGGLKEKMFYAPRWANHVRRLSRFWNEAVPAPGLPRLALLLPRRDILLSELSDRNPADTRYSYPQNHRWMLFRWLRERGYWVDVIPCTKLTPGYLRDYQALCLIGAEHLTATETETISTYVNSGGVLIADARAGLFDEHHREARQLDNLLGFAPPEQPVADRVSFNLGDETVTVRNPLADPPSASLRSVGSGRVLYFPYELGSMVTDVKAASLASVKSEAATAESEEYTAHAGEFTIGRWLAGLLARSGLRPACAFPSAQEISRVEQPLIDSLGNLAVVVSTRAHTQPAESLPAGPLDLALPGDPWSRAYWGPAETDSLTPLPIHPLATPGQYRIDLPAVSTAGVIHLFKSHAPLLGIDPVSGSRPARDPHTAQVTPGSPFDITVTLLALTAPATSGTLSLAAPAGWSVSPAQHATLPLTPGANHPFTFTVTPAADHRAHKPDWLVPLTALWHDGAHESATAFSCVEVAADPARIPHLLTDNTSFPKTYPYLTTTGATYSYLAPADPSLIADPLKAGDGHIGAALTNGFSSIGGLRHSHHRDIPGTGHFARYRSREVDILFDLKADRDLMKVVLVTGTGPVYPTAVRILAGTDEHTFESVTSLALDQPLLEIKTPLFTHRGRYVRVQVKWPAEGGILDEIEIWGR
ncbi:MAG: beta-galactosidase [Opitutaceae bacterium]|jgi:hypothetical protein